MARYMRNPSNNLIDLARGEILDIDSLFFENKSGTFQLATGNPYEVRLECVWSSTLPQDHIMKIYKIEKC